MELHYRVVLKMLWHRSDGTVQLRSSHLFNSHSSYVDGVLDDPRATFCSGEIRVFVDGPVG